MARWRHARESGVSPLETLFGVDEFPANLLSEEDWHHR
jgi:hypothetical protein